MWLILVLWGSREVPLGKVPNPKIAPRPDARSLVYADGLHTHSVCVCV